jgi:hypothetical protein
MSQPICAACGKPWHAPSLFCRGVRLADDQVADEPEPVVVQDDDCEDDDELVAEPLEIGDRVRLRGQPAGSLHYDHGVVINLEPFEDAKGRPHVQVEAAPDCYARHTCLEADRLVLVDYSCSWWRITAEDDARCELQPHEHYQVDLEQECRGKPSGPHSRQSFTALQHELVRCRDVGPAELTLDELMQWRPRLQWVQRRVDFEKYCARDMLVYCPNRAWTKDERFDWTLQRAIGPHSEDTDGDHVYPWLRTEMAAYWTFRQFFDQLPDCRGCLCP